MFQPIAFFPPFSYTFYILREKGPTQLSEDELAKLTHLLYTPTPTGFRRAFLTEALPLGSLLCGVHYIAARKNKFLADRRLAFFGTLLAGTSAMSLTR